MTGADVTFDHKVSYDLMVALTLEEGTNLRRDLVARCLKGMRLGDTDREALLVEAHVCDLPPFNSGLTEMCTSTRDR